MTEIDEDAWLKAKYFVIKSFDEDNIHKSIKYGVWCSTYVNNMILNEAFLEIKGQYPIILLFRYETRPLSF